MVIQAICPNNKEHKRFITVAHVVQSWIVDERGNFIESISNDEVTHHPNIDNIWTCNECGAEAIVSSFSQ